MRRIPTLALALSLVTAGCSVLFGAAPSETSAGDAGEGLADAARDASTARSPIDPQFAGCGDVLEGWGKRTQISIDYNQSDALEGFPLLVAIPADVLASMALQDDAKDLYFSSGNGAALAYEIEVLDATATSYVWVATPLSRGVCGTSIWMYSDNPLSNPSDMQGSRDMWSQAQAVWHFADPDNQHNSVSEAFVAERQGAQAALSIVGGGAVGRAQRNSRFDVSGADGLVVTGDTTWESRFYIDDAEIENQRPMDFGNTVTHLATRNNEGSSFKEPAIFVRASEGASVFIQATVEMTPGWHYMAIVVAQEDTSKKVSFYLDGVRVEAPEGTDTLVGLDETNRSSFTLGLSSGDIDDVRISSVARPSAWIELTQRGFDNTLLEFSETVPVEN